MYPGLASAMIQCDVASQKSERLDSESLLERIRYFNLVILLVVGYLKYFVYGYIRIRMPNAFNGTTSNVVKKYFLI
jgi:hypothetical protein